MEFDLPKFSIIIPCFNQGHFLEDCLNSILSQDNIYWEAIIVNDGSTDSTLGIAQKYEKNDLRIKLISQPNQGLSAARNTGIREAKGDFLLFLDSDDWIEGNCLSNFSLVISENPSFELYRCGYGHWDYLAGNLFHEHFPFGFGKIYPEVLEKNLGPCHSIIIRSKFAIQLGSFDTTLKSCEDWDFWIRAGKMGANIYSIPEVLVAYRYVLDSMSRNPEVMYTSLFEVSQRSFNVDLRLPQEGRNRFLYAPDFSLICKNHLLPLLGILIQQGREYEAVKWYLNEKKKWDWEFDLRDWENLSSYLNWKYFLEKESIAIVLSETVPRLHVFLNSIGYSIKETNLIVKNVFAPQIKKLNHLKYGKLVGAIINKIAF